MHKFLTNKRKNINKILITYIMATLTNILSGYFSSIIDFMKNCVNFKSFSVLLMWLSIVIIILINTVLWPISKYIYHKEKNSYKLRDIMEKYTSDCFKYKINYGGYSWGKNKCLLMSKNIFDGYRPEDIVIEDYKSTKYSIPKDFIEEFEKYKNTEMYKKIVMKNNNMFRCMLIDYNTNFNKSNKKMYIKIQKTDYATTKFFWEYYRNKNNLEKQKIINDVFEKRNIFPNSFCLHLALITKDDEVIVTATSNNKKNDYPYSWAATIGEQLEINDFSENADINSRFVKKWIYRALLEEFGLYEEQTDNLIAEDGVRILALNSEGDINNISLMTVVHMTCSFEEFKEEISLHPEIDKEFSEVSCIQIKDIPYVLKLYSEEERIGRLHPSSYLRLFLCYIHRKGIYSFVNEFENKSNTGSANLFYEIK